ncbi:hypothetical protein BRX37_19950 [Sphingomonas sp. S-NIH.Pt3_0716]|nr:hypothetical protein BRX37_19950 [Sphingomonas sp. S-NIH.Pt3_0716]
MTNSPSGLPETAADRFLREERERAEFYRKMVGGGVVAEAVEQARAHHKLLRDVDVERTIRPVLDALKRDRADREAFRQLASNGWALSVAETARSISQQSTDLIEQQRKLSSSVLDTVRAFDASRGAVATAIAAAKAESEFRQMIAGSLAQFSAYGAIAERMRMVDMMTLRASEGIVQSATALAADMVMETQRIAEAIAAAPTEAQSSALAGELLEVIVGYITQLGPNTVAELQKMGLIQWFSLIIAVIGFYLAVVPAQPHQSPEEKAAHSELSQKFDTLQRETHAFFETEARADDAYVSGLPRAELAREATLRRKPERAGEIVLKAQKGMVLAIEKSEGRWRLVVFRDPLSNQLARAWVYATAVTPLADPLEPDERLRRRRSAAPSGQKKSILSARISQP